MTGVDDPFVGLSWMFGPDGADNQNMSASFLSTSGILARTEFPQFNSWPSSQYDKPGGPFSPHTGDQYVYSQISDLAYKRLTREIAVPAGGGNLTFWTSYDTEPAWDHLFVEARTAGGSDWTTLPDANGHTTTAPGRRAARPAGVTCTRGSTTTRRSTGPPVRARGPEPAASGTRPPATPAAGCSGRINLNRYAGQTVEISIAYAS